MEKHYVTFRSPGTFLHETTTKEIASWDIKEAIAMMANIIERHSSKPFGFSFTTKTRNDDDFEPRITNSSKFYHVGGKIQSLAEIKAKEDANDRILIINMENNGYAHVITSETPWRSTRDLNKGDIIVDPITLMETIYNG